MTFVKLLRRGVGAVRRHPWLLLAAYLAPLVPALLLTAMARSTLAPVLDFSMFSARILDGSWFSVWRDFATSPASDLGVVLGSGFMLALLLTALVQVPLAAGTVEVLLERDQVQPHPFFAGVAAHTGRFLRSAAWFVLAGLFTGGAAVGTVVGFAKLAEKAANGRFDLLGLGIAGILFLLLMAVFDPAYALSRAAAARHGDGGTLRGFLRAVVLVLRHPAIFLPLFLSMFALIVALHLGFYAARSPWTPDSAAAVVVLLLAQQLVMLVRAFLHVAFWGAEIAAYRLLGEPRLCERRRRVQALASEPVGAVDTPAWGEQSPESAAPKAEDVFETS